MKEYQEIFSYELDASDKRMVEHNLTYKSKEALIQEYLKEITLFTNPYLQTIHFRYKWIIACLVFLDYPKYKIEEIHEKNLEYEKEHPPVIYEKKKKVASKREKKVVQSSPVKVRKDQVTLLKISSNKSIITSRSVAEDIIRDYPNQYKILEDD